MAEAVRASFLDLDAAAVDECFSLSSRAFRGHMKKEANWPSGREDRETSEEQESAESFHYHHHNSLIDVCLKLFAKTASEKYQLSKELVSLMPFNAHLLKLHAGLECKVNGPKSALLSLHDHLSLHQIDNEHLWIL